MSQSSDPNDPTNRRVGIGDETRWPAIVAVLVAIVLQLRVPESLSLGPTFVVPIIAVVLLVPLLFAGNERLSAHARHLRQLSMLLIFAMNVGNYTSLGLLIRRLVHGRKLDGRSLLLSGFEIWFTGVIVFGLWLWELDRGGPEARARGAENEPDLLFPQMSDPALSKKPWSPELVDYLYVSLTNSTAFSPTDTLPLTRRIKLVMALQSLGSLSVIAVLGARAVNIL